MYIANNVYQYSGGTNRTGEGSGEYTDFNTGINDINGGYPSVTSPRPVTDTITQLLVANITEITTTTFNPTLPLESPHVTTQTQHPLECGSIVTEVAMTEVTTITVSGPITTITEVPMAELTTITEYSSTITITEAAIAKLTTISESSSIIIVIEAATTKTLTVTEPASVSIVTRAAITEVIVITDPFSTITVTDYVLSVTAETSLVYTGDNQSQGPKLYNSNSANNRGMLHGEYSENEYQPYLSNNECEDYVNYSGEEGGNDITGNTEYFIYIYNHYADNDEEYTKTEVIDEDCIETPYIDSSKCTMVLLIIQKTAQNHVLTGTEYMGGLITNITTSMQ
ncbi:hypothetical protein K501DRAFT_274323 [Backusella circina FSU 941]|nr:hypothetical protein K501DRAFT_274323 [Backusella circina FSU 941]